MGHAAERRRIRRHVEHHDLGERGGVHLEARRAGPAIVRLDTDRVRPGGETLGDGRPIVVLVPGDRRADGAKIAAALGARRARVAPSERVEELTGFEPGAVAPFPLPGVERVLIERLLLAQEYVWVGAGSGRHMAGLAPSELRRLARAQTLDAVHPAT